METTDPQGQQWLQRFQESSPAASARALIWIDASPRPRAAPSAAGRTLTLSCFRTGHLNCAVQKPDLRVVLFHVDVQVRLPGDVDAAHERIGHRRFRLVGVVGAVVVGYQTAQAGRGDVPGKMTTVLLFIAWVTTGGRERQREGEEEEERQRPGVKPSRM